MKGHSLLDVYMQIAGFLKVATLPVFLQGNHYEVEHNVLDINRAKARLGWQPRIPFDRGLLETLQVIIGKQGEAHVSF